MSATNIFEIINTVLHYFMQCYGQTLVFSVKMLSFTQSVFKSNTSMAIFYSLGYFKLINGGQTQNWPPSRGAHSHT